MKISKKIILPIVSTAIVAAPVAASVSCSPSKGISIDRSILNKYGTLSTNILSSQRSFDVNFTSGNTWSGTGLTGPGQALPLVRYKVEGKDIPKFTDKNGKTLADGGKFNIKPNGEAPKIKVSFSKKHKEYLKFEGAESITFGLTTTNDISSIPNDLNVDHVTFNIPKGVYYVNYKGEKTKYELKGKDFLYGMIRTIYGSKDLRTKGLLNKKKYTSLPKFSNSDNKLLEKNDGKEMLQLNNKNNYLLDLFGIDISKTIQSNETAKDNEFVLAFKSANDAKKTAITGFIANNSMFSPQSSDYIDKLANEWIRKHPGQNINENPGIKYGISNYLSNKLDGINVNGYKDALSVGAYYYTKFDLLDSYVFEKNKHYIDQSWSRSNNTIKKYVYHILPDSGDENAIILQRISNYKKGLETILDKKVYESKLFNQFKENPSSSGYTYQKIFSTGIGNKLVWDISVDPLSLKSNDQRIYNDKGLKMMYGDDAEFSNFKDSFYAVNQFYNGNGKILRSVINNAVNIDTIIEEGTSLSNQEPLRGFLAPEQKLWDFDHTPGKFKNLPETDTNYIFSRPTQTATNSELEKWYATHSDPNEAYKAPLKYYDHWKQELEKLAKNVQATKSDKAKVPIQFWEYRDNPPKPKIEKIFDHVVDTLNSLSDSVEFIRADALSKNDFISGVQSGRSTQFHYIGWGADYQLAASLYQGLFSAVYGNGAIFGVLYHDFITDTQNPIMPKLKTEINGNKTDFPILNKKSKLNDVINKIGISTIRDYAISANLDTLSIDQRNLLSEIENAVVRPFYTIASNEEATRNMAKYYADHALSYPFASYKGKGYGGITKRIGGSTASELVIKPWLSRAVSSSGTYILRDYRIER